MNPDSSANFISEIGVWFERAGDLLTSGPEIPVSPAKAPKAEAQSLRPPGIPAGRKP
jgi:hypothetical protein